MESSAIWKTVKSIRVHHAKDPRYDLDICLDGLWAIRQKSSVTREDLVKTFIEDAKDLNKWHAESDSDFDGNFITSATITFKDDPEPVVVSIPVPEKEAK